MKAFYLHRNYSAPCKVKRVGTVYWKMTLGSSACAQVGVAKFYGNVLSVEQHEKWNVKLQCIPSCWIFIILLEDGLVERIKVCVVRKRQFSRK